MAQPPLPSSLMQKDLATRINEESMTLGGGPIVAASVEWG
jgi:hypothetical protein